MTLHAQSHLLSQSLSYIPCLQFRLCSKQTRLTDISQTNNLRVLASSFLSFISLPTLSLSSLSFPCLLLTTLKMPLFHYLPKRSPFTLQAHHEKQPFPY